MQSDKKAVIRMAQDTDYVVMDIDLEDLPHGDLLFSKQRENGTSVDFHAAIPGIEVLAYDEKTGCPAWAPVSNWSRHKGCLLEIVNLSNGDQMFTDDDPRAVYGIAVDADSLIPERFTPSEALRRKVMVPSVELDTLDTGDYTWYDFTDRKLVNSLPEGHLGYELTYAFGEVLGAMAGDGWWAHDKEGYKKRQPIRLADHEGFVAAAIKKWIAGRFPDGKNCWHCAVAHSKEMDSSRYGDSVTYSFSFPDVNEFRMFLTESLGGERDEQTAGSGNKRLPLWISGANKEFKAGVLNGLVATDGCVTISNAKSKPQLILMIGSTSLRLLRDARALCRWLGIDSAITFSKKTSRGNDFWSLGLSTPDCKKTGIFSRLCHDRKRQIFTETEVSIAATSIKNDWVPFPEYIYDLIKKYFVLPNITDALRKSDTEEARRKKEWHSLYQSLFQYKGKGYLTRDTVNRLVGKFEEKAAGHREAIKGIRSFVSDMKTGDVIDRERGLAVCDAINNLSRFLEKAYVSKALAILRRRLLKQPTYIDSLRDAMLHVMLPEDYSFPNILEDVKVVQWIDLCRKPFMWHRVERVEKTGREIEGYDLTVPGYDTFASDSGVVLSNTMTFYVPVSNRAVKESVEKMLPSKNLLAARNYTAHYLPQEEIVLGTYLASRPGKGPAKMFNTKQEAILAYKRGLIDLNDNIQILEE